MSTDHSPPSELPERVTITDREAVAFIQAEQAKNNDPYPATTATKLILAEKAVRQAKGDTRLAAGASGDR
jgi:hypothetical protein